MQSPVLAKPSPSTLPPVTRLRPLEEYLRQQWRLGGSVKSLRIRTALRNQRLLVLGEHPASVILDPDKVFAELQGFLERLPYEFQALLPLQEDPAAWTIVTGVYLRWIGQQDPYASQSLKLCWATDGAIASSPAAASRLTAPPLHGPIAAPLTTPLTAPPAPPQAADADKPAASDEIEIQQRAMLLEEPPAIAADAAAAPPEMDQATAQETPQAVALTESPDPLSASPLESTEDSTEPDPENTLESTLDPLQETSANPSAGLSADPTLETSSIALLEAVAADASPHSPSADQEAPPETTADLDSPEVREPKEPLHIPRGIWLSGVGLCALTFVGSFYIMSRPCVTRQCQPLEIAQQKTAQVADTLQGANTSEDVEQIRRQLQHANRLLSQVPFWSRYSAQAQGLRSRHNALLTALEPLQKALYEGSKAAEAGQQGPLTESRWLEIHARWEGAIALLRGISPQSPVYAMAQDKLKQYDSNRLGTEDQLRQEREGVKLLAEVKALVKDMPKAPTESQPDALSVLQKASDQLQDAIALLKQIPRGTTASEEAAQLLAKYQGELTTTEEERQQEQVIIDSYRQGLANAEQARVAEGRGNWPEAQTLWKSSLELLQQVPSGNPYYADAQTRVGEYSVALQQAELQVQRLAMVSTTEDKLKTLCAGVPLVCTYRVSAELISVQLTLDYERAVLTAGALGDPRNRSDALGHVQALEQALEILSNESRIPLEVYDPDGALVGTHRPSA